MTCMMTPMQKLAESDLHQRRVEVVRTLCRGKGVLAVEPKSDDFALDLSDEELALFGVTTDEELYELLVTSVHQIPDEGQRDVLHYALGNPWTDWSDKGDSLRARRESIMNVTGKSYRTLMRHEQEAIDVLCKVIERLSSAEVGRDTLGGRVTDLEVVVLMLRQALFGLMDAVGRIDDAEVRREIHNIKIMWNELEDVMPGQTAVTHEADMNIHRRVAALGEDKEGT